MTAIVQRTAIAAVLLLALSGCANILESVDTTYNRSVDFSALKTYSWWSLRGLESTDANDLALIRTLIDKDLQAKGLQMVDANPDFNVVVFLKRMRQVETSTGTGTRSNWRYDPSPPIYWGGPVSWNYEEGTMVVDFVRPKTNHMVWRGTFKTDLDKATTPEKRTAVIERAVKKIMQEFPPA